MPTCRPAARAPLHARRDVSRVTFSMEKVSLTTMLSDHHLKELQYLASITDTVSIHVDLQWERLPYDLGNLSVQCACLVIDLST